MSTFLISLLILLAEPVFLGAQTKTDRELAGLLGPVHSVRTESEGRAEANGSPAPRVLAQIVVFDERGSVTEHSVYKTDGSLERKLGWGYVYDGQGRQVKRYFYNDKGQLTNTGVTTYDESGRRSETTQINPNGSINHIQSYFYDDKGNKIREAHRNADGSARNNIMRSYDAKGRVTEEIFYTGDGSFHHKSAYTFDNKSNPTGWTVFKEDGSSVLMFKNSHSYDQQGKVKETIGYGSDNSVKSKETFSYDYDNRGNWIKRTTSRELFKEGRSEIESEVTHRTIAYF